jgi:hypothetical protein
MDRQLQPLPVPQEKRRPGWQLPGGKERGWPTKLVVT